MAPLLFKMKNKAVFSHVYKKKKNIALDYTLDLFIQKRRRYVLHLFKFGL